MTKIVEDFKTRYRIALVMTGMKAVDISKKTGISESTLSQYLKGYSKPKDERLALLADVLGVDPLWLKGFDVPMNRNAISMSDALHITAQECGMAEELLSVSKDMNEEGLKRLIAYAEDIKDKYRKDKADAEEVQ